MRIRIDELVRDLDRRRPADRLAVERQESLLPESLEHRLERDEVGRDRDDLRARHPATTPRSLVDDRHQPQEERR